METVTSHPSSVHALGADTVNDHAPESDRYDSVTRFFHWVFGIGIIYASIEGYTATLLGNGPVHDFLSHLNMSVASVLIVLFPMRLLWKFMRTDPRKPSGLPAWQFALAHRVHDLLYVVIFVVLSSGFLMVPDHYVLFGVVRIDTPFAEGEVTRRLFTIHRISCAVLAGLALLHILAVVKHQLIARCDVLRRML
ncbi:cytochrome b/b6 domain-containing protein [Burkholderia plantarii]|uniref:cytochrome b n=1 Tax=Burkholderia plantarii TaxID=41899 RepID=UPI00272AFE38|nr:cytochrome b/b6 domain-containing protein [Burkholderia plantarii]WLE62070.1 cytochrome b/b6 domain-containing protein [Burkholderia plantarii]